MTLPDERYRAVVQTRRFLLDLCNSQHTPRVPKLIRETARAMLRHYPSDWDMQRAAASCPEVFAERMEDLHRFVLRGSERSQTLEATMPLSELDKLDDGSV